ncbi:DNA processing protein DprA [Thiohalobacter sp. COW1]|uniref:DNA-processing protein DprA n=1 Tax=Thiohalobacter sp. COW1 TaxID=2795687 RepID=UPI0019169FAD|nr:DNA-processing protein DprA [Thiohalobacter sp. COW1]BCO32280.1 DNA processing protein DprA [Thiohalobacter sp. COW1]
MDADRLRDWLTLWHSPGLGAHTFNQLIETTDGRPEQALRDPPAWLKADLRAALRRPDRSGVERDLTWRESDPGNHIITRADAAYPQLLAAIPDPPPLLYVHGDPARLNDPQLALVGSRNPTRPGRDNAFEFARYLAAAGLTLTSGLALGVDAAGHQGALKADGYTLAVMGTGLDRVYPARHRDLAHAIVAAGGALVSELPVGSPPRAEHFPRRNRIISGLSLGVLVVEAALRSGSLITARAALEQGREVFAIPGSIHNPLARGCHALIRQGAKLVETGGDVLEELHALASIALSQPDPPAPATAAAGAVRPSPEQRKLLEQMGYEPVTVDQLVTASGLTPEAVSSMLLILELEGRVASQAGGAYLRLNDEV